MSAADLVVAAPSREPTRHSLTTRIVIYGLLILFAAIYLVPLVVMVMTSLKPLDEVTGGNMFALPRNLTFAPWVKAWSEARIGHDLSWIVFRFEKLSCQIILLPPLRPGHVDVAVLWSLESNLRHRTGDVIRCDRLHEHI